MTPAGVLLGVLYAAAVLVAGPIVARRLHVAEPGYREPEAFDFAVVALLALFWPLPAVYLAIAGFGRLLTPRRPR